MPWKPTEPCVLLQDVTGQYAWQKEHSSIWKPGKVLISKQISSAITHRLPYNQDWQRGAPKWSELHQGARSCIFGQNQFVCRPATSDKTLPTFSIISLRLHGWCAKEAYLLFCCCCWWHIPPFPPFIPMFPFLCREIRSSGCEDGGTAYALLHPMNVFAVVMSPEYTRQLSGQTASRINIAGQSSAS